jgi:hypothetical protein
MSQNFMTGRGGAMSAARLDQLAPAQNRERRLDSAFGQASPLGNGSKAGRNASPSALLRVAVKIQVYEKSSRLLIMTYQICHQNIEDIVIDWNGGVKARHAEASHYTDKRTAILSASRVKPLDSIPPLVQLTADL